MKKTSIFCPGCGTIHEVVILENEPQTVQHIRPTQRPTTWLDIKKVIASGHAEEAFKIGDKITTTLKDGQTVEFTVAAINPYGENQVAFVMEDLLDEAYSMNSTATNKNGWSGSELRHLLNTKIFDLLPDELAAVIQPRKITQNLKGKMVTSEDALWLLSYTEMFGDKYSTDVDDVHFPLFNTYKSRVKNRQGVYEWYWLRSPYASGSTDFMNVNNSGSSGNYGAGNSNGVSFGFLI